MLDASDRPEAVVHESNRLSLIDPKPSSVNVSFAALRLRDFAAH